MVKSILAFEEVGQVGLADVGRQLSQFRLIQRRKSYFLRPSSKSDDPSMLSDHLDDRNMMMKSLMPFGQSWVSTGTISNANDIVISAYYPCHHAYYSIALSAMVLLQF